LSRLNSGDLIALLCAVVWATFNIASRRVAVQLPATVAGGFIYGGGGLVLLLLATPQQPAVQLAAASPTVIACVMAMGVVSSALGGQLYLYGIRVLGVSRAVLFVYLVPVTTAGLAWLVFGETISAAHCAGGAAVLVGLALGSSGVAARALPERANAMESTKPVCDADRTRAAA
jgi:drug/metabolite transporter (DMT)-like permease